MDLDKDDDEVKDQNKEMVFGHLANAATEAVKLPFKMNKKSSEAVKFSEKLEY